ncbi:MAG TPA: lipocalin family protein, partial [Vicinamibacterales bacterium]
MKAVVHVLTALALCLPLAAQSGNAPLRVVDSVELTRYAGRWYEAARYPNKFQSQCAGDVVVHYALRS